MNKRIIIVIAVSLAVLLVGIAIIFAVQNRNDTVKDDEVVNNDSGKESISSETDDLETTDDINRDPIDSDLSETEREEDETDKSSSESSIGTDKETKPSDKDAAETKAPSKKPAETKVPSKKPAETKAPSKKPEETKAPSKKPAVTKPAETKPAVTKPVETKPAETKPAETKPVETKPVETKPVETKPVETKPAETEPERTEPMAADFTIYDGNGNEVHLSDFAGKPVILNFWASWCVPCKKEMPDFNEKYLEYGDEIQFLMIDFAKDDKIEDAKEYVSEMGFKFPVYFDVYGDATSTYKIDAFPTTIFIDADGYIMDRYRGTISEETLQSGIDKILK